MLWRKLSEESKVVREGLSGKGPQKACRWLGREAIWRLVRAHAWKGEGEAEGMRWRVSRGI